MIAALGLILVLGIVTTAATRRYIREQAGSERSLTVGPEAMYEAEPFAAEAVENGLAEDAPEPSSKKWRMRKVWGQKIEPVCRRKEMFLSSL